MRVLLTVLWAGAVAWLWQSGWLGAGGALIALALGLLVLSWPARGARRRRGRELRYVEVAKEPITAR